MKYPQLVSMPSEISNWLDEQLEARGIDAVVYTRYILSLLNKDSVDVVCPDQDFVQPHKEVRRSGSGRKHFRCFSGWRNLLQADAEKLKRTAAIECLMSASDQDCGIETLVDELCEKLKETKNSQLVNTDSSTASNSSDSQATISPQDLIQKYYAAFPPLTKHNKATGTPNNSIAILIPKWFSSPKKKSFRRQNRSASFEDKLHCKVDTDIMKPRFSGKQKSGNFSRNRNDLGFSRNMAKSVERSESMSSWDLLTFSSSKNKSNFPDNKSEFENIVEEKAGVTEKQNHGSWSDKESMTICGDLPVDILDLLDSPGPRGYTVEMMNLSSMKGGGSKNFIQCGTNITSSIWSVDAAGSDGPLFDNTPNTASDVNQPETETLLGMKFESLTVGSNESIESIWSNQDTTRKETYETYLKTSFIAKSLSTWEYSSGLEKLVKWSDAKYDSQASAISKSLIKLNHAGEASCFVEVKPKSSLPHSNKTMKPIITEGHFNDLLRRSTKHENLLTSKRTHFCPIDPEPYIGETTVQKSYKDGECFQISGSLEKPNYIRSPSGCLYLASEKGSPKKLMEYKTRDGNSAKTSFILKFVVQQNDKACQTEEDTIMDCETDNSEVPCKKRALSKLEDFYLPGDRDKADSFKCTGSNASRDTNPFISFGRNIMPSQVNPDRSDSVLAEMWKDNSKKCDVCNKNTISWTKTTDSVWRLDSESLENIWNGGEVCQTCINLNGGPLPRNSQLREDVSQDGEQLLSDLSTLQLSYYMELPAAETSYDISELLGGNNNERKRRHSPLYEAAKDAIPVHRRSWGINSLLQVASVPVLNSVTL